MADTFDRKRPELWIPRDLFAEYCGEDSPELLVFYDKATRQKDMLTMSFVYFNIWQIKQTEPKDFAMGLIGFGKDIGDLTGQG